MMPAGDDTAPSLEDTAAIAYAALAEYGERAGDSPWPRWDRAERADRQRMRRRVLLLAAGYGVAAEQMEDLEPEDARRWRLFTAIVRAVADIG